jgi:hypothetical protein
MRLRVSVSGLSIATATGSRLRFHEPQYSTSHFRPRTYISGLIIFLFSAAHRLVRLFRSASAPMRAKTCRPSSARLTSCTV